MSSRQRYRMAVLFHAGDRHFPTSRYIVHHLAEFWREDGHDVRFLFGVDRFEAADIIVVHVNLSVVPEEYMSFASRYPVVLNGRIADIRKSTVSPNVVGSRDDWAGPVIVKSDLNYAGLPEAKLNRSWLERRSGVALRLRRKVDQWLRRGSPFRSDTEYEIYDHLADVPTAYFASPQLVVEKFLPEADNGLFFTRYYQFLGNCWSCFRLGSTDRIVKAHNSVHVEAVEPHDEVLEWRRQLSIDYGKLDYVIFDGRPVLLDVNKTIGASRASDSGDEIEQQRMRAGRRRLAEGIYDYL